jgi:hypothetical protein
MNPRLRVTLFALAGTALAVAIGTKLADESYGLAVALAGVAVWLILKKVSLVAPQAWLLAAILVGYVVGNRGFAQLQPARNLPLLPAEAVLLISAPVLAVRMTMKKSAGLLRDPLNYAIMAWMAVGALRLPFDLRDYGVVALRDFAMVYYGAFFFIAQDFGTDSASARMLRGSLTCAFLLLMPAVISVFINPDFLLTHLTWQGIPLIYHKSDLVATSLAAGFFWLWTRWDRSHRRGWLVAATLSLLLIGTMGSPRAGMVAVFLITLLWVARGRWRIAAYEVSAIGAAMVLAVAYVLLSGRDIQTSLPYSMYEHVASLFDPGGHGTYINNESGDLGGNNQFRLVWWKDVIEDTVHSKPLMGQGFGADLSARFLADFDLLNDETFAARSPHSMIVTVFGRMGMIGFLCWMAISAFAASVVWRLFRRGEPDGMGLACVTAAFWFSSCVGVVLEGPMGAVIFWTALGLANSTLRKGQAEGPLAAARERPVAMPVPLDTQSSPR